MQENRRDSFRERVRARQPLLGTFLFIPSADVAEAVARTGVDFVIVDMEHSPKSWQTVSEMVRAAQFGGAACLVRVAANEPTNVLHALEVGADGVVLPFIESAADVERAVSAARYAPEGQRGTCTMSRAAGYGALRNGFAEIAANANERITLIGQLESVDAIGNVDQIVDVTPGLDAVIVGRADLASSLGHVGMSAHPSVTVMTEDVMDVLNKRGDTAFGLAVYGAPEDSQWASRGASVFVHAADVSVLLGGFSEAVEAFRKTAATTS